MRFFIPKTPKTDSPEGKVGRLHVLKEEGFNVGEAPRCPRCKRFLGALSWLPPYRIELETWGKSYGDIERTGDNLVLSERLLQIVRDNEIRGLSGFEPIEVVKVTHCRGKPRDDLPRYFRAAVTRSPTTIDQEASGYVWRCKSNVCPVCLLDELVRRDAQVVDESTWSGDDVFFPRGGMGVLVSERFKRLCDDNAVRGVIFIPAEDDSYDNFPWKASPSHSEGISDERSSGVSTGLPGS